MENLKFDDQKSEYISRDKNNNVIRTTEKCACGISYYENWTRIFNKCNNCSERLTLREKVKKLEEEVKNLKNDNEEFVERSKDWHERDIEAKVAQRLKDMNISEIKVLLEDKKIFQEQLIEQIQIIKDK